MAATAADYTWFGDRFPELAEAYCLTLVHGLRPEELLDRTGACHRSVVTGVGALVEAAYDAWDEYGDDLLFAAVAAVGEWALMVEPNGYLGTTDKVVVPLSRGTRLVSHFRNVNAVDHFFWLEDGETRLHFEPLFAYSRDGSDADGLVTEMERAGFDLSEAEDRSYELHTEAAFALAEQLTGVRLTPELLDTTPYLCGLAPLPRS